MWGIVPAAGRGSRIQPLAFSKELLPVGSRLDGGIERPCAVSEYLVERMIRGGADKICFVISPGKSDILEYYGGALRRRRPSPMWCSRRPSGLCDAIFRAVPLIAADEAVLVGLPDTVWFPEDGLGRAARRRLSFLLFPVERPELFDAVVLDGEDRVREIQVKQRGRRLALDLGRVQDAGAGAARAAPAVARARRPRRVYRHAGQRLAGRRAARRSGVKAGSAYVDVGTLHGYREAIALLGETAETSGGAGARVALGWPGGRAFMT